MGSESQTFPRLDANPNAVVIQTLRAENEGWGRDYEVNELIEPSFVKPRGSVVDATALAPAGVTLPRAMTGSAAWMR